MKLFFSFVFALLAFTTCTKPDKEVYIFTSHREPALDGLHYLYSYDGYHWDSIAGSWLKPEIGNKTPYYNYFTKQTEEQKYAPNSMMRDPSITQGPDGTFHLVWTISWNGEQGFGYASSKDLIHWSEQREIKVMKDSLTNNVWELIKVTVPIILLPRISKRLLRQRHFMIPDLILLTDL